MNFNLLLWIKCMTDARIRSWNLLWHNKDNKILTELYIHLFYPAVQTHNVYMLFERVTDYTDHSTDWT
jgi:hypothetical protein